MNKENRHKEIIVGSILSALTFLFVLAFILWTVIPDLQMALFLKYERGGNIDKILKSSFIFSPYSNTQYFIRNGFLVKSTSDPKVSKLNNTAFDTAISLSEEMKNRQYTGPYEYLLLGSAYAEKARISKNKEFSLKADEYYKKAIDMAPYQQKLRYAYGSYLISQNKISEAKDFLEETLAMNELAPPSHFYFGIALFASGVDKYTEALNHIEIFLEDAYKEQSIYENNIYNQSLPQIKNIYLNFLKYFYSIKDKENLLKTVRRLERVDSEQKNSYSAVAESIEKTGIIPDIIIEK